MSLLDKIRHINSDAARDLEEAGYKTDPEIKSLDRTDICELFGGKKNLKLRKDIIEVIHPKRPVDDLVRELKDLIPHRSVGGHGSVLAGYLCILKEMKTQMDSVQNFLNAHISLVEELSNDRPPQKTDRLPVEKTWDPFDPLISNSRTIYPPPERQENDVISGLDTWNKNRVHSLDMGNKVTHPTGDPQDLNGSERRKVETEDGGNSSVRLLELKDVKYNMIVSGTTFNAHQQLINEVMNDLQTLGYRFLESSRDHQVTLLFIPITSRVASNTEAAMSEIKDDKPVILVLMHHEFVPTSSLRRWINDPQVVLEVNIFFHETKSGLFSCQENSFAISDIRNKLVEYSTQTIPEENLKCGSERRKEAEGWDQKQDLYDDKKDSKKSSRKNPGLFGSFFKS